MHRYYNSQSKVSMLYHGCLFVMSCATHMVPSVNVLHKFPMPATYVVFNISDYSNTSIGREGGRESRYPC